MPGTFASIRAIRVSSLHIHPCFTPPVLGMLFRSQPTTDVLPNPTVQVGAQSLPLLMVRHPRARRYLLRLRPDGTARVTIPRRGTVSAAWDFVQRNVPWLEQQWLKLQTRPRKPSTWCLGANILFRGQWVPLVPSEQPGCIRVDDQHVRTATLAGDLRPAVEHHLRRVATHELSARVLELAAVHGLTVRRVAIRNQRTRWGSCSRRGTLSLNWRLIQTPAFVSEYVCLHELAHLVEMNHSARFWRQVERMCPDYRAAERWLKDHPELLGANTGQ
jgi:predicted metal-dependent hydrolase